MRGRGKARRRRTTRRGRWWSSGRAGLSSEGVGAAGAAVMAVFNEKHCSRPALVLSCIGKRPPPAADVLPELFGGGGGVPLSYSHSR